MCLSIYWALVKVNKLQFLLPVLNPFYYLKIISAVSLYSLPVESITVRRREFDLSVENFPGIRYVNDPFFAK